MGVVRERERASERRTPQAWEEGSVRATIGVSERVCACGSKAASNRVMSAGESRGVDRGRRLCRVAP